MGSWEKAEDGKKTEQDEMCEMECARWNVRDGIECDENAREEIEWDGNERDGIERQEKVWEGTVWEGNEGKMLERAVLIVHPDRPDAAECAERTAEFFISRGIRVEIPETGEPEADEGIPEESQKKASRPQHPPIRSVGRHLGDIRAPRKGRRAPKR